jgi:glycosyltransferase involved in cell wall biosynthesis
VLGYDAVDNDHFCAGADKARARAVEVRSARGLPARYLLACGRFMAKKNFHGLIDAFADAIARQDTGHDLVILGDGPERARLEETSRNRGMERRIHLPGFRSYDALPDYYGLADGFAHVATSEQWGLVVNEAAASGLPLVVSRPTGAAALVHEARNGFLVDPDNRAEVSQALDRLMGASRESREEMGKESRRIVDDWGPRRFAQGLKEACEHALRQPPRRLAIIDRILFRALSRFWISTVT